MSRSPSDRYYSTISSRTPSPPRVAISHVLPHSRPHTPSPTPSEFSLVSSLGSSHDDSILGSWRADRRLPSYRAFLSSLTYPPFDTLSPNASCPLSQEPYTKSIAEGQNEINVEMLDMLDALPESERDGHSVSDIPVRLPCASEHVVGFACFQKWFQTISGRACPLDREKLFRYEPWDREESDNDMLFEEGQRGITHMPLRIALKLNWKFHEESARVVKDEDLEVQINAMVMGERLGTVIICAASRLATGPNLELGYVGRMWNIVMRRSHMPLVYPVFAAEMEGFAFTVKGFSDFVDLVDEEKCTEIEEELSGFFWRVARYAVMAWVRQETILTDWRKEKGEMSEVESYGHDHFRLTEEEIEEMANRFRFRNVYEDCSSDSD
ncbi:hypothetical protein BCR34DRAFT_607740 [Clohesyomyces aquaticus]|uniref:Uncharacterized protein n=1 Tax=Clohesyomyces aquaticus TaxID=1231657 RepID=A0A1Y1YDP6_9PLEO|nr:hypothetical protein BCR34DRAFT_607740 [Clohesyomyces aquaticus]